LEEGEIAEKEILEEEERKRRRKESKKEGLEIKAPEKIERKAEEIPLKKKEEHLIVPLIKLEKISELELKKLEVSKEIPQIEKRRRTISIPIIKLHKPSFIFKEYLLDYEIPKIEKAKKLLSIPVIRVSFLPKISISISEFSEEIRKPKKIILPKIRVPIYRKDMPILPKLFFENFDSAINDQIKEYLKRKEKEPLHEKIEAITKTPSLSLELKKARQVIKETELIVSETEEEFEFLIPEELLDKKYLNDEYYKAGGFSGIPSEGLVCILVDKSRDFHELIKLLCTKIWRIKSKGLPTVTHQDYDKELSYHWMEEITEFNEIEKLIKLKDSKDFEEFKEAKKEFIEEIKSKTLEGQLRFLLLPIEENLFGKAYDLLKDPKFEIERYLQNAKFMTYKLGSVNEDFLSKTNKILTAMFGFVKVRPHSESIGENSLELEGEFRKKLEESLAWTKRNVSSFNMPKPGKELTQEESWLHWILKHLVYRHLIKNMKVKEEQIKSEVEVNGVNKIADVYVSEPKEIAIEIETMWGTGDPIEAKISPYTVKPYLDNFKGELWLVIPNLQALLYARELLKLRHDYKKGGLNLEVYITDVTGEGARCIYKEEREPGLIKLVDVLNFIRRKE